MLRTIFVPLDGSPIAARAVHYAAALARATGARLLLHLAAWCPSDPYAAAATAHRAPGEARRAYLDSLVTALAADGVVAEAALAPEAAQGVVDAVRRRRPDLVVMASSPGPWRGHDDGVAEQVLRALAVPVLLVPATSERPWLLEQVLDIGWRPAATPASVGLGEGAGTVHD
jgi:nucleotide-binding universal stress UspA family protein